jgi:phosphatidylglycerophosphate synthase
MSEINRLKREFYEKSAVPLGRACLKAGLTPNILTAISLVCAVTSGIFFWRDEIWLGVVFMILTSITDMLDGSTARAGNIGTLFGGVLDHVCDRYGEFFILAGITLSGAVHPGWGLFALFGMVIASYTRAAAESIGKIDNCAVGIMGRLEKFALIIVGAILDYFFPDSRWLEIAWFKIGWFETALMVVGTTSYITSIQRLWYTYKILKSKKAA